MLDQNICTDLQPPKSFTPTPAELGAIACVENGINVLRLHAITERGACTCWQGARCPAAGKHPLDKKADRPDYVANPELFDEHLAADVFRTGYGIDLSSAGLLVVDIDDRDGSGVLGELLAASPEVAHSECIVGSGSGGASKHYYFRIPEGETTRLRTKLADKFPKIDFKHNGFTVGPGSLHKSGGRYEIAFGSIDDIDQAPESLLALLRRPVVERPTRPSNISGNRWRIAEQCLELIECDPNGASNRPHWLKVGGHLHAEFGDAGFDLWNAWSATGETYDPENMLTQWESLTDMLGSPWPDQRRYGG